MLCNTYIIILHWNNFRCTDFCLEYLLNVEYNPIKVVVVDNGSTDNSVEQLKKKYSFPHFISLNENLGFARGTNIGIKFAYENNADFIVLLNNDVEVSTNLFQNLLEPVLLNEKVGMVTPKIYYRDNRKLIWHAGGDINHNTITAIASGYDEIDDGQYDKVKETNWASGACCLISRDLIDKIGFLEEKYFFGQEEWDYSTSAIRAGFKIVYNPKAIVYHEIAQSSSKSPGLYAYQNVYNKHVYAWKYLSIHNFILWFIKYFIYVLLFFPKKNLANYKPDKFYLKTAKLAALYGIIDFCRSKYIDQKRIKQMNSRLKNIYKMFYDE
jgi:GT2 family glycosyltransferase